MHPRTLIVAERHAQRDGHRELRLARRARAISRTPSPRSSLGDGAHARALQDPARKPARVPRRHDGGAPGARQPLRVVLVRDRRARSRARTSTRRSTARAAARRSTGCTWSTASSTSTTRRASSTRQPNCSSREVYKGMLDGASHGVFNGKVYVQPDRAEDRRQADEQQAAAVRQGAHRHQAAARDLRRRREVHARRDGRPDRRDWRCST